MKLIVGLGNPGPRHRRTRHNVGFEVIRRVADRARVALDQERYASCCGLGRIRDESVLLLLPQTWMNRSGEAVHAALHAHPELEASRDVIVVFDDLDLPPGRLRIRISGGAGGHNGLANVLTRLGTRSVPRLRFGIGRPPEGVDPIDFVLGVWTAEERAALDEAVERAAIALECFAIDGAEAAMNRFNAD